MTFQLSLVVTAIAFALTYVGWATVKTWIGSSSGCGRGRGCGKCAAPISADSPRRVSLL